ncbi:hypothetical protein [Anaerotignum sp.]|uniref:hypothetical protein n=1 Tax=Anaerotignum sp. TaxID=2039241 RepID=UPI0033169DF7
MKDNKNIMQIVSGVYFLVIAILLFLWIHFFSGEVLRKGMIPVALVLIALWFLLIYIVMKHGSNCKNNGEDDK